MSEDEYTYFRRVERLALRVVDERALDTLVALVEEGPLSDGSIPSKNQRDLLFSLGLAYVVMVNGDDGYQAAVGLGRDVYKFIFGKSATVAEAKAYRQAADVINKAK